MNPTQDTNEAQQDETRPSPSPPAAAPQQPAPPSLIDQEQLHAKVSRHQLWRLTIIAVITNGLALWSFYDGIVAYPAQQERATVYEELQKQGEEGDQDAFQRWIDTCAQRGWSTANPGEAKTDADIQMQYLQGTVAGLIGLAVLTNLLRTLGRTMTADRTELKSNWGPRFKFSEVVQIDKKKWDNKGIAKLRYQQEGKTRTFVLDDYKFERPPTDEMLRRIEAVAGVDKIIGGKPEPQPTA
jgi:hypothetical protein